VEWLAASALALALWAIAFNGLEFELGGTTATPERLLSIPLVLLSLLVFALRERQTIPSWSPMLLVVWLIVGLVSSLLSPVSEWSMRMWLVLAIAGSFYFVPILLKANIRGLINGKSLLFLGLLLGPIASLVFAASIIGIELPPFLEGWIQVGGGTRLKASASEANLLGAFLPMLLFGMLARDDKRSAAWWVVFIGLNLSMVFCFSRAPWIAYVVGLLAFYVLNFPRKYSLNNVTLVSASISMLAAFFGAIGLVIYLSFSESENIARVSSIYTRLLMWGLAVDDISAMPLLGSGIFSFSELHPYAPQLVGSDTFRAAWISNLFLAVLHDTGLVGLVVFTALLTTALRRGWARSRYLVLTNQRSAALVSSACISAFVCMLISGQSIPGHSLGFFWLSLALIERSTATSQ
jgi:O-antigen ligase